MLASSPHLPGGPYWPGGIAAHASGDLHMVFGHWAHRLSPGLEVLASHRLPVDRPHNSFVVLDGGELVMKDCDAPAGLEPSTVSALDPHTLLPVAPPLRLPEPSIARLASDGDSVIILGTTVAFRRAPGPQRRRAFTSTMHGSPPTVRRPGRSYGWDPVITDEHVLWMDNGRNSVDRSMLGTGISPDPVRLWWARRDDARAVRSVEISGLPFGTESNPPAWDPVRGVVIAYDAGNAVLRAWRMVGDELEPLWRRDGFAHAGHLILYTDTRELVVQDWKESELLRRPAVRRHAGAGHAAARALGRRTPRVAADGQRPARRPGPGQRRREGARGRPLAEPGLPVPGPGFRPRRLLPVAHDDRSRRGPRARP